jgi:acetyl esterase/lipase
MGLRAMVLMLLVPAAVLAQSGEGVVVERGLVYRRLGVRTLELDVYRPRDAGPGRRPAVICIHGGGWKSGDRKSLSGRARDLAERGFVAASIDYRLSGEALFPAAVEDAQCAVQWLAANSARFGIDPARLGVFGVSAGGHLALMVATAPASRVLATSCGGEGPRAVQACASWYGPADLVRGMTDGDVIPRGSLELAERFLGGPFETHRRAYAKASPATHVNRATPPLFLAHGDHDGVVPYSQSEYMKEAAQRHGVDVTLLRVHNAGHGFRERRADPPVREVWLRTVDFFIRCLWPPSRASAGYR